jgi:menaquinol-cytochrome c reductase iron-sulfur subunit
MSSRQPKTADPPAEPGHCVVVLDEQAKRRNVVYAILATVVGSIVGLFPFLSGLALFLDPAIKRRKNAPVVKTGEKEEPPPLRRVASLGALDEDGTPMQVPVIADLKDIWTVEPSQHVGAVYLRKTSDGKVECLNAICPHAGCFVAYSAQRKVFQCPCHNSAFNLDGTRILPSPSPRDMDPLNVELIKNGGVTEVLVAFTNFYSGKEHPERKPS